MKRVGIALAGLGFMGRMHTRCLKEIPEAELVAAWSKFPEEHQKFSEFTRTIGIEIPSYHTELREMLENPRVEAVICAIPPRFMGAVASEVIEAGKPVLVECPPGSTPADIAQMEAAASARGVRVMPGHCYRFAPAFRKVKELLGGLGKPLLAHFREFVPAESLARQWSRGSWIWKKEDGGPIPTMTVFCMDLARWILDSEPAFSFSTLEWQELEDLGILGYDVVNLLKFRNGVVWTNEFSGRVRGALNLMRLEIVCEDGRIMADGPERVIFEGKEKFELPLTLTRQERWGHKFQDECFVKGVVLNGESPPVTLEDARIALEMSLAILESSKTGLAVKFS